MKPVSSALAREMGFTSKGKRALFLWKWAFSGLLFLFKSSTCPLLYRLRGGRPLFCRAEKGRKDALARLDAMRFAPAKRRAVFRGKTYQVLPCRAARQSEVSRLLAADTSIPRRLIIVSLSRDAKPIVFFYLFI